MIRLATALALAPILLAAPPGPLPSAALAAERVPLACAASARPADARVLGAADPASAMERMVLLMQVPPKVDAELEAFLAALQDPASPDYHRWLTPEQFGERFGPSPEAVAQVTGWLADQGFRIDEVGRGRRAVVFSGTAAAVQQAFGTAILRWESGGQERFAHALPPTVPRFLAGRVAGLLSLGEAPRRPLNTGFRPRPEGRELTALWWHFLAPGDFATIYNLKPLYADGVDGTGAGIAVIGRAHPPAQDALAFRRLYGLPDHPPTLVIHGPDPGSQGGAEDGEANLDVEWAGAVAPKADVTLVVAKSTRSTDGVDLAALHAVDRNLAPVISVSFGACEASLGTTGSSFYAGLWAQAAAQGITVVVASGDSGPAGCEPGGAWYGSGAAVSGLASTPHNVAVGGTQFQAGTRGRWDFWTRKDGSSARGYIPEAAWNESGRLLLGFGIWASGGGASALHPKPAWQEGPGVPDDGQRDLPDVSLAAASGTGYLVQTGGWPSVVGGTSCAAPAFAGIMALVIQRTGERQGNPNPVLYRLAAAQAAGTGPQVFHDILVGDTHVAGTSGFAAGAGFDLATGLGSLDAAALVAAWPKR